MRRTLRLRGRRGAGRRRRAYPVTLLLLTLALAASAMPAQAQQVRADGESGRHRADPDQRTAKDSESADGREWVGAGDFRKVYDTGAENPSRYLNDHSVIKGPDGTWHMYGITGEEAREGTPPDSAEEDTLAHATAPSLSGPWTTREPVLTADPEYGEDHLWAPHVIEHQGTYYMFYSGGGGDRDAAINLATSTDLEHWTRDPGGTLFRDGWVARDPFVTRVDDQWVMYYTATERADGGKHVVAYRTSDDLRNWGERKIAFTDTTAKENSAPVTESPFVVRRGEWWYLFIGPRGDGYVGTDVFRSKDPTRFQPADLAGHFPGHAPEVVQDGGKWWVTHCGWFQDGLHLAELHWRGTPPLWNSERNPVVTRDPEGRLELYALAPEDRGLLRRVQKSPGGAWGGWEDFGDSARTAPTVGTHPDGRLELFAVEDDGTLIHRVRNAEGDWGEWDALPGREGAPPQVVRGEGDRLELFGLTPGGDQLTHRRQDASGDWGEPEHFGGPAASPPAVAADSTGRLQVFVVERGGAALKRRAQTAPGGGWGEWTEFGGPTSGRPVVAAQQDGRLEVFALGPYGDKIARRGQRTPGGDWGEWSTFGGFAGAPPTVTRGEDGRLEVFALGPGNDYVSHRRQTEANGGWGDWQRLGGPAQCVPQTGVDAEGRLTVFAVHPEGAGLSSRTRNPGGEWGDWTPLDHRQLGGTRCGAAG
ncbi:family 43 glycosylhydrolase [Streptomyces sp. NPDC005438]|uniref:family 43 glycosylhydrolase n=1 Tax=Streptomyces sp. NPDC005438 TaxID=3156880 RepID=UPI0033AE28CF